MHDGDGLQEDESTFRIHHEPSRKPCRSVRHGHMRFPCPNYCRDDCGWKKLSHNQLEIILRKRIGQSFLPIRPFLPHRAIKLDSKYRRSLPSQQRAVHDEVCHYFSFDVLFGSTCGECGGVLFSKQLGFKVSDLVKLGRMSRVRLSSCRPVQR